MCASVRIADVSSTPNAKTIIFIVKQTSLVQKYVRIKWKPHTLDHASLPSNRHFVSVMIAEFSETPNAETLIFIAKQTHRVQQNARNEWKPYTLNHSVLPSNRNVRFSQENRF